jgi:ATP-dependent RNA helicase RhlE
MSEFTDLGLKEELVQNLAIARFVHPTPIQVLAIPHLLNGSDLIGISQTGTGKTGAFSIPIIHHLIKNNSVTRKAEPRALIIAPTRELCSQIQEVIALCSKNLKIRTCVLFGGVEQSHQVQQLQEGVEIVIATPGRLMDLLDQKLIRLAKVEMFVLDEADRMLDMGFIDDIRYILEYLPNTKQSMLFSATLPQVIEQLTASLLKDPKRIEISLGRVIPKKLQERLIYCKKADKFQLLKNIIKEEKTGHFLVFTKTKSNSENIVQYLALNRTASKAFHGDMKQVERERALTLFKEGSIRVLVATDMAARGIDIDCITHVINFDLPLGAETYIHRIGRTARAGKEGIAISFCDDEEKGMIQKIQDLTKVDLKAESFEGKKEILKLKLTGTKKITPPTPGKSQEKTAYLDHSKRQKPLKDGEKRVHPGLRNQKKKKRK